MYECVCGEYMHVSNRVSDPLGLEFKVIVSDPT